jgi:hypothetical protein
MLAVLLLCLCAVDAFARAGGGEGYHGGGYSGSSSGSGGGDISGLLFYLLFRHPLLAIAIALLYWYFNSRRVEARETSIDTTIKRGMDFQLQAGRRQALEAIRARDPHFEESAFLGRASGSLLKIQEAWSAQDMAKARAFVSDGVFERFTRQIDEQRARGLRNLVENVSVLAAEPLGYRAGLHFEAVYVGFRAAADDRMVALSDGAALSGGPDEFSEVWTFLRRPGAKTLARPGLLEGHCPSCGAALSIADAAQCGACKVWVNSGEHDWVLTAITQTSEWAFPDPEREVDGWEDLRESDPDLSLEALEDRAAMVFWRLLDARRRGELDPLRAVASEEFLKDFAPDGYFERDAAVGAVETILFEPGDDVDRVHVQVRWEADKMAVDGARFLSRDRRTHYLIFQRKAGVTSDLKAGLSAARCPSCGAAPEKSDAPSCAYCGRPFNDGSRAWVLAALVPFGVWQRPAAAEEVAVAQTGLDWGAELAPAHAVAVLAAALGAHGLVDDREKAFLRAYADKRGVPDEVVAQTLAAAAEKRLEIPAPGNAAEAEAMLRGLIRMALADGRIQDGERALLTAFGGRLSLGEKEVRAMIREERTQLHAKAKTLLAG